MRPEQKPKMTREEVEEILDKYSLNRQLYPVVVVGIRGYYKRSMGDPERNDRGIYDDAIFIHSDKVFKCFNANTDPATYRPATDQRKGMAVLQPGGYIAHVLALHKGEYLALCQRVGQVTVLRDAAEGDEPVEDTGYFGINIHKGGLRNTYSEGCQTIVPEQWDDFIDTIVAEMRRCFGALFDKKPVPYILVER